MLFVACTFRLLCVSSNCLKDIDIIDMVGHHWMLLEPNRREKMRESEKDRESESQSADVVPMPGNHKEGGRGRERKAKKQGTS